MTGMGNQGFYSGPLASPTQAVPRPGDARSLKSGGNQARPGARAPKRVGLFKRLAGKITRRS
jgi:hypothetical protein